MKSQRNRVLLLSLFMGLCSVYAGDLRVNLVNGTKGGPAKADRVAVIDLSQGMAEMAGEASVNGSVSFSNISAEGQKQYLIRATVGMVNYTSMFIPDPSLKAWEMNVEVFDSEQEMRDVHVEVPYFVIYAFTDHLYIQKRYIFQNHSDPPVTFSQLPGVISVHVPDDVLELDNLTFKQGTMPLKTQAIAAEGGKVIPNALKPGAAEIDIAYTVAYDPNGTDISEIVGYDIGHFHVYTMPMGLSITAPGLASEGQDQQNGLDIWALENVKAKTELTFRISGKGMTESDMQQQQSTSQQSSGKLVVEHRLPMSNKLVMAGVLMLIIISVLFFSITQQQQDLKESSVNMLKQQKKDLLKQYTKVAGDPAKKDEFERIERQLISVYKTLDRIK